MFSRAIWSNFDLPAVAVNVCSKEEAAHGFISKVALDSSPRTSFAPSGKDIERDQRGEQFVGDPVQHLLHRFHLLVREVIRL